MWPDEEVPDDKVSWEITVGALVSPATPLGASTRLSNLDYFDSEPTAEMTDDLKDAVAYFQCDNELSEITGELNAETCAKLRKLHDAA